MNYFNGEKKKTNRKLILISEKFCMLPVEKENQNVELCVVGLKIK